jgi:hypothetical protein|tara:strand:+ start:6708 stop:7019 length:312 start_codon:yes stop_codon:yes gene_type:complete
MTDSLSIIRTYSQTLTDSELAEAWRILYDEHQQRGEANAKTLKYTLHAGDQVEWTGRGGVIRTGEVVRVKRKKVIVSEHLAGKKVKYDASRWDIPLAMLRKIV